MDEKIKTVRDRMTILLKLLTRAETRNNKLIKLIPEIPDEPEPVVQPVETPTQVPSE